VKTVTPAFAGANSSASGAEGHDGPIHIQEEYQTMVHTSARIALLAAAALFMGALASAEAQDKMKKDMMKPGEMKSDAMKSDGMKKSSGTMKSDSMKDSMTKDSMKSDSMKKK
jgi:pentapeptide MXKDX repeat protein